MSKHPDIAKVRKYLIESGYPAGGDALLSLAAVEADLNSKATIESALTKAVAVEPVAVICDNWDIRFVGAGPIAPIVAQHGLKIGDKLYAHAQPSAPVASVPDRSVLMPRNPPNGMLSAIADTLEEPSNERSSWDLAANMYAAAIAYLTPTNQEGAAP